MLKLMISTMKIQSESIIPCQVVLATNKLLALTTNAYGPYWPLFWLWILTWNMWNSSQHKIRIWVVTN